MQVAGLNNKQPAARKLSLSQTAVQATAILMGTALVSKVLGFVRDVLVGKYFGTSRLSDALTGMIPLSTVFQDIMNGAVVVAFIPLFLEIAEDKERAKKELKVMFSFFAGVLSVVLLSIAAFSNQIVQTLLPGLPAEFLSIAANILRIFSLSSFLWAMTDLMFGVAQARKHFLVTAALPLLVNTFIILSLLLLNRRLSVVSYPLGAVAGTLFQLLLIVVYLKTQFGYSLGLSFAFKGTLIPKVLVLSVPLILQQLVTYGVTFVGNSVASSVSAGAVASLSYSNKMRLFVTGILTTPIAVSFYPFLSEAAARKDTKTLRQVLVDSIRFASFLVIPATVVFAVFSEIVIKIVYMRGAFDYRAVALTSEPFFYFSLGIYGVMLSVITSRVLYSLKKMKVTLLVYFCCGAINVALLKTLTPLMGHSAIALSTSISVYVQAITLSLIAFLQLGRFSLKGLLLALAKILLSSTASVFAMVAAFRWIGGYTATGNLQLFILFCICGILFILVYVFMLIILRLEEVTKLRDLVLKRFSKFLA